VVVPLGAHADADTCRRIGIVPQAKQSVVRSDARWVGEDGWYAPHDYWLSLCGLYDLYAFCLERLGPLHGKSVLDCGCGQGHTSVMLAKHGARVTAFDTSEPDLATARMLAQANAIAIDHRSMPFERLDLPDASFDLAFGACVLHHVDIDAACGELARVLKPGGRALFIENSARNALLMFARRYLVGSFGIPRYGDDHEHPLTLAELHAMRKVFRGGIVVHNPDFLLFRLGDFYILRRRSQLLSTVLRGADRVCGALPLIRKYGYFQVIEFTKP
jgi:2-polyprenyl-3-methyl-5-hydroxy-6-metoxy-1,4-benzoquinol methylase